MQVSRGPVREALNILEYEGLVTYEPKKGCKVTKLSSEDTYEVFYLRGSLEIMSLKLAGEMCIRDSVKIREHNLQSRRLWKMLQ